MRDGMLGSVCALAACATPMPSTVNSTALLIGSAVTR